MSRRHWVIWGILLLSGLSVVDTYAQAFSVRGYVSDAQTGTALMGAHVHEARSGVGTTSNMDGFFSLALASADTAFIQISYVGYHHEELVLTAPFAQIQSVELVPLSVMLDSVSVEAARWEDLMQMSKVNISMADVETLPMLGGEADVLKAIQLLPGIQSGVEGASGMYVRGGSPDQNLVLLDGATLYNVSHLFGFLSTFNTSAFGDVTLYKGGFPARYGGRLSSVLDMHMREGNRKAFDGRGNVGLVASSLTVEGPIQKERSSFIVSARRTYLDVLTRPFQALINDEHIAGYYFYDANVKSHFVLSAKDRISVSAYSGNDRLYDFHTNGSYKTFYDWHNMAAILRWNRILTPRLVSDMMVLFSRFHYRVTEISTYDQGSDESLISSGIQDWSIKWDMNYQPRLAHIIRFGGGLTHHVFTPGTQFFHETISVINDAVRDTTITRSNDIPAVEGFLYAEDRLQLSPQLEGNIGVHISGFHVDGHTYSSIQPRLSGSYFLSGQWMLNMSYVLMRQYIHLLSSSGLGLPTDLWLPSTTRVRPQNSWQGTVGFAWTPEPSMYHFSIEGYYKSMNNIIEYREGSSIASFNQDWESDVVFGRGWSYGTELLLQKRKGGTSGWIGYTLSWTGRRLPELNQGRPFPYRYDRRHDVSIVVVHKLKRKTLSVTWVYGTGNAVSMPVAQYTEDGQTVNIYGDRNSFRMPAYHRLDVSVHYPRRRGKDQVTFSAYNLYSRRNPLFLFAEDGVSIDPERGLYNHVRIIKKLSLFPIVPSVNYRFTF